jgi:lipoprotein-releasing system ATP-binding protein
MTPTVTLAARGISKHFYDPEPFKVLSGVSFEVYGGEFLTLVGKSGSGKSTLLYCLSTMDNDYEGDVFISGQRVTGQSQHQLAAIRNANIGFVFQFHYLLPEFSCLKNVMIPALRLGHYPPKVVQSRAMERLAMLGLADQAHKPASKLSGGQQQRVSIARALINDPKIILCDEPTGNLDSKNSQVVFDIFQKLAHENGQTIICVTHDTDFASASDRTIELADGQVVVNHADLS